MSAKKAMQSVPRFRAPKDRPSSNDAGNIVLKHSEILEMGNKLWDDLQKIFPGPDKVEELLNHLIYALATATLINAKQGVGKVVVIDIPDNKVDKATTT
jgi:hypothetical protein